MRKSAVLLRIGLALVLILCLVAYFAHSLASLATNGVKMAEKMTRYADTSLSGVSADAYPAIADAITGYLKGTLPTPQITINRDGQNASAFAAHELLHLADIRGLVHLAGVIRYAALAAVAISFIVFLVLRKWQPGVLSFIRPQRALVAAMAAFFALVLIIVIWAAVNFEGLFYAFHRLLFRNDLWLLDPQKDLLLQLMPLPFFVSYGWDLLKQSAAVLLILPLAAFGLRTASREKQG